MDDYSLIRTLVQRAVKTTTQTRIASSCRLVTRRSLSRWLNGDPFPNLSITVPLLRTCGANEEEIEKAVRAVESWKDIPIPPPTAQSELSDADFLTLCTSYSRPFLALRGTGMDKAEYRDRFGSDGMEFIEKIRKSKYFSETETTFVLGQTPFATSEERATILSIMADEHKKLITGGAEERATIAICKARVRPHTLAKIREHYFPLWKNALDLVNADQQTQKPGDETIVFSLGSFLDTYVPNENIDESSTTEDK